MASARLPAPLEGWKARGLGLRRIAGPESVNGRIGRLNVNSGRGAGVQPTLSELPGKERDRPPVNGRMGRAHVNWGRRREPRVRRQSSPSATRCSTLVGIARAASSGDQPACAANDQRRGRREPSGSWWAGPSRARPGLRGSARRCTTMTSYSAWLFVSALPVAEASPQARARSSLAPIDSPRPSSRVSRGGYGPGSPTRGPKAPPFITRFAEDLP